MIGYFAFWRFRGPVIVVYLARHVQGLAVIKRLIYCTNIEDVIPFGALNKYIQVEVLEAHIRIQSINKVGMRISDDAFISDITRAVFIEVLVCYPARSIIPAFYVSEK